LNNSLQNLPTRTQITRSICKESFYEFFKRAWDAIETDEYLDGWYIKTECDYAQSIYEGKIKDLIINQPPRTLKSTIFSVAFPAWVLAKNPKKKFMCASYAATLAYDIHNKCRKLINSDWYQELFPEVKVTIDRQDYFETSAGGYRFAVGVDGGSTGRGCDVFIGDDLLKPTDSFSDQVREKTNRWFDETITTRRNSIKTGARIIVCQRLHENDIVGYIESKDGKPWEKLILPMEYDGIRFVSSIGFVDPRKEMGESLHPERFNKDDIEQLKIDLGSFAIAGQLQQRPVAIEGSIVKEDWLSQRIENTDIRYRFISFDTAGTANKNSAYSCAVVGELTSDYRLFIREVWREKVEFWELCKVIEGLARKYKYGLEAIYIENKSSGTQAVQNLKMTSEDWINDLIVPVNVPAGDGKEARARAATIFIEQGCILLPTNDAVSYPWLLPFLDEITKFPATKYKDQMDAFSQLINQLDSSLTEGLKFRGGK